MKCTICKNGETKNGFTTTSLTRKNTTIIIRGVPSQICENCGESFFTEEATSELLRLANIAVSSGIEVEVREYKAA